MLSLRRFRSLTWLAALLAAMHACWPLLAQAGTSSAESRWICTAQGLRSAPADPALPLPGAFHGQAHCVLCASGGDSPCLPAAQAILPDVRPAPAGMPMLVAQAVVPAPSHPAARPRAPPLRP